MSGYAIACGSILAAGAYLRWGVRPVTIAYQVGRIVERIRQAR